MPDPDGRQDHEPVQPREQDTHSLTIGHALFGLALVSAILGYGVLASSGTGQTDVLILSITSFRADHLTCYGYHRNTTPNICAIADDGIRYTDANAQQYWTTPSEASIQTGLYPDAHGLLLIPSPTRSRTMADTTTLAETLGAHGYDTALHTLIDPWTYPQDTGLLDGYATTRRENTPLEEPARIARTLKRDDRSFIYVHSKQLHRPYTTAESSESNYSAWYDGPLRRIGGYSDLPRGLAANISWTGDGHVIDRGSTELQLDQGDIRYLRDEYDDTVRHIDHRIGELVRRLRDQGTYESTLLIITAPHGESLGEPYRGDGGFEHRTGYEEVSHVPLIIKPPGNPGPTVVDEQVQLIDIYPTVLDVLNIPVPSVVQGHSILPPTRDRDYTFMGRATIMNRSWKLFGPRGQADDPILYNMTAPQDERHDVSHQYPRITAALQAAMKDWQEQNRLLHAQLTGRPPPLPAE